MIPKTIHYVWLGGKNKPKNFEMVYTSWMKHAPSFTFREWNEKDIGSFMLPPYFFRALTEKKWAFASDVFRFYILERHGGIYLDIDEVLLKDIDSEELLGSSAFLGLYHEVNDYCGFGFIGSEKGSVFSKKMIQFYENYKEDPDIIVNKVGSSIALSLQKEEMMIFPQEYFYPLSKKDETSKTYARHLSNTSWVPWWKKVMQKVPGYFLFKNIAFRVLPKKFRKKLQTITY